MDTSDAPARSSRRPSTAEGAGITSGSLARRLGISPTTLRSWDRRYDLGPARRDEGRHRRWSPQDVAMIEEMCRLTASGVPPAEAARVVKEHAADAHRGAAVTVAAVAEASGSRRTDATIDPPDATGADSPPVPPGTVRAECRGLIRAALRLDSAAVQERLNAFVRTYGVIAAWEELMMPTLHAVGRKWETSGDRYVEVEHLLSWHVSTALRNTPFLLGLPETRRDDNCVLLACVPGEQHTLPLEAVHAALLQAGRPARMLGAAVPADALVSTVRRTGPAAVMLWSQARSLANTPLAQHLLQSAWGPQGARQQPRLHLAGPGWRGATVDRASQPAGLREAVALLAADPR